MDCIQMRLKYTIQQQILVNLNLVMKLTELPPLSQLDNFSLTFVALI